MRAGRAQANVVIAERLPEPIEKGLARAWARWLTWRQASMPITCRSIASKGSSSGIGVEFSRSTMCDWMAVAAELLAPIVEADDEPRF